ncbi:h+ antiporter [Moniliophthora roreri]|uniref:Drug:h+ antiporter n=2 Tax=Moniliophthora roreri TaxID=221103 RepID=A0A0W0F8G4_MONRR|nr:h+ antiporter [Moniliophthora roreri]
MSGRNAPSNSSIHSKHSGTSDRNSVADINTNEALMHTGVLTVEATHKVFGSYSKWYLFIGLGLAAYIYSLDGQTTYSYLIFAASDLKDHSLIATIQVVQSIIIATFKPVVAKTADVASRGYAYLAVLIFYVLGYIVIASAQRIEAVAGGIVLYAIGYTGLQLLTQIIIADITTLKWRGLVSGLISLPFVINAFIGANIVNQVLAKSGWRWGYGMFAILIPASLSPLIITLLWAERKAKKLNLVPKPNNPAPILGRIWDLIEEMDIFGLMLIGASVALILLPLTLAKNASNGWNNPSMIAMIVVGFVLLPFVCLWEFKYAKFPVLPLRYVRNRSVIVASAIGFFDFVSFYLTFTYLYSFVLVVKPWSTLNATYFTLTQSVALTVFGILGGVILRFTHHYKWCLVAGLAVRLLGCGIMIHSRGAQGTDAEVVWTQILQGLGGGFAAVTSQVGAQASVPHIDVAMVTAVVLLLTEVGGAVGNAIAGAIWSNQMPDKLAQYLPNVNATERASIYSSISFIRDMYPEGSETRDGIIRAYSDVMRTMVITATAVAVVPLVLSLLMPDWYLGDTQNAVDDAGLEGAIVAGSADPQEKTSEKEASA